MAIREHLCNDDGNIGNHSEFILEQWKPKDLLHLRSGKLLKQKGKVNKVASLQVAWRLFKDVIRETLRQMLAICQNKI